MIITFILNFMRVFIWIHSVTMHTCVTFERGLIVKTNMKRTAFYNNNI